MPADILCCRLNNPGVPQFTLTTGTGIKRLPAATPPLQRSLSLISHFLFPERTDATEVPAGCVYLKPAFAEQFYSKNAGTPQGKYTDQHGG
ncbi:hypothetical protein [Microcoleus sp. FACHB-68]|uniref:hypothetical protein n=1 Tax=Microcoleus sp. FACHB-68 TaxID=2692826 RepID=UPI0016871744|nr:hypothetical protein [Microcoleus sp. FACHB-68]MBD1938378.1 hypothetical protein [Microcoleus sp. FACHB-68]